MSRNRRERVLRSDFNALPTIQGEDTPQPPSASNRGPAPGTPLGMVPLPTSGHRELGPREATGRSTSSSFASSGSVTVHHGGRLASVDRTGVTSPPLRSPSPQSGQQQFMSNGDAWVEKIHRLPGGACGNLAVIRYYPASKTGSPSGGAPESELRVMKEIECAKGTKVSREKKHFMREPSHPNMMKYHYFGPAVGSNKDSHVQVQMEMMDLGSLRRCLLFLDQGTQPRSTNNRGVTSPPAEPMKLSALERLLLAVNVGYQIVAGLDYFHHFWNGMHRDVKPDNVLLNSEGKARLCDFDTSLDESLSGHTLTGTLMYLAPEVIEGGTNLRYERQCDVWMAGMVLHEIATGAVPFQGMHVQDLLGQPDFNFAIKYEIVQEAMASAAMEAFEEKVKLEKATEAPPNVSQEGYDKSRASRLCLLTDLIAAAPEFEKLLRIILVRDPQQRGTTCDVLLHPFFASVARSRQENVRTTRGIEAELSAIGVNLTGSCVEMMESWKEIIHKCLAYEKTQKEERRQASAIAGSPAGAGDLDPFANSEQKPMPADPHEPPFKPTKHIKNRKAVNKFMKDVIHFRQLNAITRLAEFLKAKSEVLRPILADVQK